MTQKTKLSLIWIFLRAAKPRLGSRFVKSKLVPHQTLLTTTHKTMSSTCSAISHAFGTHRMVEAAYLCSWTALFFSFSHAQTHFSPLSAVIGGKTLQSSHYCILHSKNPVCLQMSTGLLAQRGKMQYHLTG